MVVVGDNVPIASNIFPFLLVPIVRSWFHYLSHHQSINEGPNKRMIETDIFFASVVCIESHYTEGSCEIHPPFKDWTIQLLWDSFISFKEKSVILQIYICFPLIQVIIS